MVSSAVVTSVDIVMKSVLFSVILNVVSVAAGISLPVHEISINNVNTSRKQRFIT